MGRPSPGHERRRGREDPVQAGGAGEAGTESEECPPWQTGPGPARRPGTELFSAGGAASDLLSASMSDFSEFEPDVDRLPVLVRTARDLHEREKGSPHCIVHGAR